MHTQSCSCRTKECKEWFGNATGRGEATERGELWAASPCFINRFLQLCRFQVSFQRARAKETFFARGETFEGCMLSILPVDLVFEYVLLFFQWELEREGCQRSPLRTWIHGSSSLDWSHLSDKAGWDMGNFFYFVLPALGGYTLASLYLLKNPLVLHRKKRTAFCCKHISHRGGKSTGGGSHYQGLN